MMSAVPASQAENSMNPYDELIQGASLEEIQARYEAHRNGREASQREKLTSGKLEKLEIDPILYQLLNKDRFPDYKDPRYCFVFWARPPQAVRHLMRAIQDKLVESAPYLWLMPFENMHMTTFEVAQSLTEPEIAQRIEQVGIDTIQQVTDYPYDHRTVLVRPRLGFDASAVALTFVPYIDPKASRNDVYTYHHLRRDLFGICNKTGVPINTRYVWPSAHLTVARFVTDEDHTVDAKEGSALDGAKLKAWVAKIDEINAWLKETYWDESIEDVPSGGFWRVGEEQGLDAGTGTLWYGKADRIRLGKGY